MVNCLSRRGYGHAARMALLGMACAGSLCMGQQAEERAGDMKGRMDRNRLNIGAYTLQDYARTERHVREVKECGIDFIIGVPNDRPLMDLFQKCGVGAVVNGIVPGWWGGDGDNAGKMKDACPLDIYREAGKNFADHPAIWGIDIGDEPSSLDFPHYGKVYKTVEQAFPAAVFPYLNLYPNYASVAENSDSQKVNQLGTTTYGEYIDKYCECFPSDYICYDYYQYAAGVPGHYENLRIVADACRRTGRSLWIVLQVNSSKPELWITENQLRIQANSALAFGAENIIWACYTQCWWHNQVLDDKGEKTQQYAKLQKVNGEIRALAEDYMRYRNTATYFIGFPVGHPDVARLAANPLLTTLSTAIGNSAVAEQLATPLLSTLSTGVFNELKAEEGGCLIVGQMAPRQRDGSAALFLCAADDPMDHNPKTFPVTFRCDGFTVSAKGGELTRREDGTYCVTMKSCGGVLLMAKP